MCLSLCECVCEKECDCVGAPVAPSVSAQYLHAIHAENVTMWLDVHVYESVCQCVCLCLCKDVEAFV